MDNDVTKVHRVPKIPSEPKIHDAICCELVKVSKKIGLILPAIESARPGSSSGIQVLCSLNTTIEKSKLLVHYCSESSKLYLALTSESIILRCESIQTRLIQCLSQIQTMVPTRLASQIAEVLDYLGGVKFVINHKEEVAGKVLSNLLAQTNSSEDQESEAFQKVASRLNISSSTALLVERRAIKKLLDKFHNVDKKKRILMYFLHLIKTHGTQLRTDSGEQKENATAQNDSLNERINSESHACMIGDNAKQPNNVEVQNELINGDIPPEEFFCPISSSLMFDPVVIASGKTYERIFIEKWFNEGHDTCPKTKEKLKFFSLVPNSCMKDLISSWCRKHGVVIPNPCSQPEEADIQAFESIRCSSVSSLKNISTALLDVTKGDYCLPASVRNISCLSSCSCSFSDSSHVKDSESSNNSDVQLFSWSDDYQKYQSFLKFSQDMYLKFLFRLSELPTLHQVKAVEEIKKVLEGEEVTYCGLLSSAFAEALMIFLKEVCSLSNLHAQISGAQIFLTLFTNQRWELNFKTEDAIQLLSSLLNCGIDEEALMILQMVAVHPDFVSSIVTSDIPLKVIKFMNSENSECVEIAMKILSELSSNGEMRSHFLSSGCIEKIGQLLSSKNLVRFSLNILQNLIVDEEASKLIADANGCIASLAEVLEFGEPEEEQAVAILLSLCSGSLRNCLLVLKEGVIPSLVNISVNGSTMGKDNSVKLLHVLREIRHIDCDESDDSPPLHSELEPESELVQHPVKKSKKLASRYRTFGLFSRKMRLVSKSLAFF